MQPGLLSHASSVHGLDKIALMTVIERRARLRAEQEAGRTGDKCGKGAGQIEKAHEGETAAERTNTSPTSRRVAGSAVVIPDGVASQSETEEVVRHRYPVRSVPDTVTAPLFPERVRCIVPSCIKDFSSKVRFALYGAIVLQQYLSGLQISLCATAID